MKDILNNMIGYSGTYQDFMIQIQNNTLVDSIKNLLSLHHVPFSEGEVRAWNNSLTQLNNAIMRVISDKEIEVAIEYQVPLTSKRVDFIITGKDLDDRTQVLIIELKQWEQCQATDIEGVVLTSFQGNRNCQTTHPSWQVYGYSSMIANFNEAIEKNKMELHSCAFLHNYKPEYLYELRNDCYSEGLANAPCFISNEYQQLAQFVGRYIKKAGNKGVLFALENGKIRPSKMLQDALASMIKGNREFDFIDEQQVAYANIKNILKVRDYPNKQVIIVKGGAGTGKSLIALKLLSDQISVSKLTFYVTKNVTPRDNYSKMLKQGQFKNSFIKNLFKSSSNFIYSHNNELDCLIIDEAHRLTQKSKQSWMYRGNDQIYEVINASKVSIFFIDEKQQVTLQDYGSVDNIIAQARLLNAQIHYGEEFNLVSQFRCNGSDEYMAWLDHVLYGQEFGYRNFNIDYDIRIFDNIEEMVEAIRQKNTNNKARILSGDVFPWLSKSDPTKIDINIDGFSAQWNKTNSFATEQDSFSEVGCIHTAQGMEFEWVGLIIGDDLRYENDKLITDYTKHPQKAAEFKRPHQTKINTQDADKIDQLIRNTYRILLNRGQKGCYIYCMDIGLSKYLKEKIQLIRR
jgi:DUF2075 family protein